MNNSVLNKLLVLVIMVNFVAVYHRVCAQDLKGHDKIVMNIQHSLLVENHQINIVIPLSDDEDSLVISFYDWSKYSLRDSLTNKVSLPVDHNELAELEGLLQLLNPQFLNQIQKESDYFVGMDGYTVSLRILMDGDLEEYKVWNPSYSTKQRDLETFQTICSHIVKTMCELPLNKVFR